MPEARSQNSERANAPIRHFTDPVVWQKAFSLGIEVFEKSKTWPKEERYALTDQVRRSCRSVGANIAEAWGKRRYEAHFVSKLSDADTELLETEHWLLYAKSHEYLIPADFDRLHELMREIGRMLGSVMQNPVPFLIHSSR